MIVIGSTMNSSIQIELKKSVMNITKLKSLKDHKYLKRRPLEDLELFEAQLAKENMEKYYGQEVSTYDHKESTHKDNEQRFESRNKSVDT